jgi:hypothetical protein
MFFYNKKLLELEHLLDLDINSYIVYIISRPIKQIQNLLIQDKILIISAI